MRRTPVRARLRNVWTLPAALALCAPMLDAAAAPIASPALTTAASAKTAPIAPKEASYDVGLMLGNQLDHDGLNSTISMDQLTRGLKDALGGQAPTAEQRDTALRFVRTAHDALAERNRGLARAFLADNAKQPGVMTMPSGLQYRVLNAGDASAKSPLPTDTVTVRYRASLADGTEYDRSDLHDHPATFRVNSVFKGWQQAFLGMKPGAKWQLFVPPELGYGNNSPPTVPPGAILVYELELLRVEAAAPLDPGAKRGAELVRPGSPVEVAH
jgi:FKBP-type peptidyl-prolyl cis-trans isomerase FklB